MLNLNHILTSICNFNFIDLKHDFDFILTDKLLPNGFVVLIKLFFGGSGQPKTVKNFDFIDFWSPCYEVYCGQRDEQITYVLMHRCSSKFTKVITELLKSLHVCSKNYQNNISYSYIFCQITEITAR